MAKNAQLANYLGVPATTDFGKGFYGPNHVPVVIENGEAKVLTSPIGSDDSWTPAPASFRAEGYHDPVIPGTRKSKDGKIYTWMQDKGWEQTGEGTLSPLEANPEYVADPVASMAGYSEIATLFNLLRDKVAQALGR